MKEAVAAELAAAYHSGIVDEVRANDFRHVAGRLTVHLPDREVDIRVSTLPTAFGEKTVMRLFDKQAFTREILNLGLQGGDTSIVGATVPNDMAFCGLKLFTQGLHVIGVRPFALSNRQTFTIGL